MKANLHARLEWVARSAFRSLGWEVGRFMNGATAYLAGSLKRHDIDVVFDVGANVGQFAQKLRQVGFSGRIVSIEAGSEAFQILARKAGQDRTWTCVNVAAGRASGEAVLNVSHNLVSSSLLPVAPLHLFAAPNARVVSTERVTVVTLDSLFVPAMHHRPWLKIDVQGAEALVLDGAPRLLEGGRGIQLEASLDVVYEGAPSIRDLVERLERANYALTFLEPAMVDSSTRRMLQADLYFEKRDA